MLVGTVVGNLWARDIHIGRIPNHEDKVRYRRGIHRPAGARAHNHGDLRNDTRGQNVALENLCVPSQRINAFLDSRTPRVIQSYNGSAHLQGMIKDFADFAGMSL